MSQKQTAAEKAAEEAKAKAEAEAEAKAKAEAEAKAKAEAEAKAKAEAEAEAKAEAEAEAKAKAEAEAKAKAEAEAANQKPPPRPPNMPRRPAILCPNLACQSPRTEPIDPEDPRADAPWTCKGCQLVFPKSKGRAENSTLQTSAKTPKTGLCCPNKACRSTRLEMLFTKPGQEKKIRNRRCKRCGLRFRTKEELI